MRMQDKDTKAKIMIFAYKNHVAMTRERIVTALEITSGEAPDEKFLPSLVEKTQKME